MAQELDVIKVWEDLHKTPELGFEEHETAKYIAEHLTALGYEVETGVGGTGVVGVIKGEEEGPCLMLRADMDALPFTINGEKKVIHACGHDSHSAMLLAAASRLVGKVKRGKLKVLFQQGEETLFGAMSVIKAGVLEDVDLALGLHIRPVQDCADGQMVGAVCHTSSAQFKAKVTGRAAHGSRPHLGVNCAEVLAAIVQNIAMLKFDPALAWSCKCTKIEVGGAAINLIPEKGYAAFDTRAETNPLMKEILERVRVCIENTAAAYGATGEMEFMGPVLPACEYDDALTAEVAECIKEVVGEENFVPSCGGGGEDFHFFKNQKPSLRVAYFGVGCDCKPGLHNPEMAFNPQALPNGVAVLEKMAMRYLG